MVDIELKRLRKQIAKEREKLSKQQEITKIQDEKIKLRRELVLLKSPAKRGFSKLSRRFGRGLKVTSKKVGKVLLKQGRLIQEQQERENRAQSKPETLRVKSGQRKSKKKKRSPVQREVGIFGNLDF